MEWNDRCRKVFSEDPQALCNRPRGHYGLHREKVPKTRKARMWGDNECAVTEGV